MLLHRCGFTRVAVDLVFGLVAQGNTFYSIESLFLQLYMMKTSTNKETLVHMPVTNLPQIVSSPSNDIITKCFLSRFLEIEDRYINAMQKVTAGQWISFDHTFKVASNIGYQREQMWITQYDSAFIVVNENGQVLCWQLTKSNSLNEVKTLLHNLKRRHESAGKPISYICFDNCCQVRAKLAEIFGSNVTVALDLFHAIQCTTRKISVKYEHSSACMDEFAKCFRATGDWGTSRTVSTPEPAIIEQNILSWIDKWTHIAGDTIINAQVAKEVENILNPVRKGCLSGIPVGCGTNKNERRHRLLNSHFNTSRIVILLAYAILSTLFYSHNSKQHNRGREVCSTIPPPIDESTMPGCPGSLREVFGIIPKQDMEYESMCESLLQDHSIDASNSVTTESMKRSLRHIVEKALYLSASFVQFKELSTTRVPQIEDWFKSFKVRLAPSKDDMNLQDIPLHVQALESNISGRDFERLVVPGDGNCFFHAVSKTIDELLKTHPSAGNSTGQVLQMYSRLSESEEKIMFLRRKLSQEWLGERRQLYEECYSNDYEAEANNFCESGYYDSPLGDLMACATSNMLGVNICLITSFVHHCSFFTGELRTHSRELW